MVSGSVLQVAQAALCALCLGGCFPDAGPPQGTAGACNKNGTCDPATESCLSCPQDCPCCNAFFASGSAGVKDPQKALGAPDQKMAVIQPSSVLVLALGKGFYNQADYDLRVVGTVTVAGVGDGGGTTTGSDGATVWVKSDNPANPADPGRDWESVGIWKPSSGSQQDFELGQAAYMDTVVTQVKIQTTTKATASVDAIIALKCTN